jgi:hypothetical protein
MYSTNAGKSKMTVVALRGNLGFAMDSETRMRRLAREIAMDIHDISDILKRYEVSDEEWLRLGTHRVFKSMLQEEMVRWHSPMNTRERTRVKIEAMIEDALESQFANLIDPKFSDTAKVQLLQTLGKIVGYGAEKGEGPTSGVVFNISIDKGDRTIQADTTPAITIDSTAVDAAE